MGARDFPASFPSGYAHRPLSFASAPLFFHDVCCVCASVIERFMKVWCNVSVVSLETIRRDYARRLKCSDVFSSRFAGIFITSPITRSRTGGCSAEKRCWYVCWAAQRRSAVLKRPLRSMKASSVGGKTIWDTL